VEIHLTKLIKRAFIPEVKTASKGTVQETLFHTSGPLGAFSTKIRLAYIMGMISSEFYKDLQIMREIRNRFAHNTEIGSFDVPEISSRCFNFSLVDKYVADTEAGIHGGPTALFLFDTRGAAALLQNAKQRYRLSAHVFSMGIQHATVNPKPYKPEF
jgi:hypothetical protein